MNIANGRERKIARLFDLWLTFGQLCRFRPQPKLISFLFYGFVSQPIKKNDCITMKVNLIKNGEPEEEQEANCTAKVDTTPTLGKLPKVEFECKIEGIEKPEEFTGLELVESEEISGIPTDPDLLNPATVDELIILGEIKNYTNADESEEVPILNATSIDTNDSEKTGVFFIEGDLLSEYKPKKGKEIEFELVLMTGEKVKCKLPKKNLKGKIKIECESQEELVDVKIMIQQLVALNGFDEILRISKISTDKEVKCGNGKQIKLTKRFKNILSFGQLHGFAPKKDKKMITFVFVGFVNEPIKKDYNITMTVDLIKGEESVEEEVNCTAKADISPKSGKPALADFECNVENVEKPEEYSGLELVKSEEINCIPIEPDLLNPATVDELIIEGEIRNYTLDDEKKKLEEIPILNATSIDTSKSKDTGIFTIKGTFLSEVELDEDFVFEITLISGQKAECKLPKDNTKNVVKIKCELQEELNSTILMIPQGSLFDGYNEIIKINKISTPKEVTVCNGKQVKLDKKFNSKLSFRQANKFKFDKNNKKVTFVIAAFTNGPVKKNEEITVDVSLIGPLDTNSTEAICKIGKDISSSKPKEPVTLECEVKNLGSDVEVLSLDIEDSQNMTNIPEDPKLKNPSKTDDLISSNEVEEAKDTDPALPNFNATNINAIGSIETGVFLIEGQPLDDIVKDFVFNITLVTGETTICKLPKTPKSNNVSIECELDGTLEKTKIMIPETTVKCGYKELFNLNKIASKREVSCANGKLKKKDKKKNSKISFRQISHFKPEGKNIKFIFTAFIIETMKKGKTINMNVNLDKGDNTFLPQKATCTLKEDVSVSNGQASEDFECAIENVENADKCKGLELVDSDDISGVPSNPNMTNTSIVDELIEKGDIKNLTSDENKNDVPPAFTPSSFNGLGCRSTGVFLVKGKLNKKVDKHFRFNLPLSYPSFDAKCTAPESKEGDEISINCQSSASFTKSKVIIEPLTVNKNNSEVISLLSASSDDEISCENYKAVSLKKKRKTFKAPFIFRQAQSFKIANGKISFVLFLLKRAIASIPKTLEIKVIPVKENTRRRLDSENEFIPVNMDCTADSTSSDPVQFTCGGNGNSPVVVLGSDDISGIPSNETYANPASVDKLIDNGLVLDCTNNNCSSLPKFKNGKIKIDDSDFKNGIINIEGEIEGNITNGSIFNLSIFPDSYGDCQINTDKKLIECYNKEEIEDSLILIEENVVKSPNGTDLFLIEGVKSDRDNVSVLKNDNEHLKSSDPNTDSPSNSTEPIRPVSSGVNRFYNKESGDKGLSGGAIAGIVIACAVAVIAAIIIAYLFKTSKPPIDQTVTAPMENSNEIGNSVVQLKSL